MLNSCFCLLFKNHAILHVLVSSLFSGSTDRRRNVCMSISFLQLLSSQSSPKIKKPLMHVIPPRSSSHDQPIYAIHFRMHGGLSDFARREKWQTKWLCEPSFFTIISSFPNHQGLHAIFFLLAQLNKPHNTATYLSLFALFTSTTKLIHCPLPLPPKPS